MDGASHTRVPVSPDFFIMSLAVVDFMLVQNNYFSFNRQVYNQNLYRIFKVLKSLRALRAIRVMRKLRLAAEPHSLSTVGAEDTVGGRGHRPGSPRSSQSSASLSLLTGS